MYVCLINQHDITLHTLTVTGFFQNIVVHITSGIKCSQPIIILHHCPPALYNVLPRVRQSQTKHTLSAVFGGKKSTRECVAGEVKSLLETAEGDNDILAM